MKTPVSDDRLQIADDTEVIVWQLDAAEYLTLQVLLNVRCAQFDQPYLRCPDM